jgi:hypothetical protein
VETHGDSLTDCDYDAGLQVLGSEFARAGKGLAIDKQARASGTGGKGVAARRLSKSEGRLTAHVRMSYGLRLGAPRSAEPGREPREFEDTTLGDFEQGSGLSDPVEVRMPKQREGGDGWQVVVGRDQEAGQRRFICGHDEQLPGAAADNRFEVHMNMDNGYRVLLRWRCVRDMRWELETGHGCFESVERAALFANGLSALGVARLWLSDGQLAVQLIDGRRVGNIETVATWKLAEAPAALPENARFERVRITLGALSDLGLDGPFEARSFVVVDPMGSQIRTDVEVDLERDLVRVTVGVAEQVDGPGLLVIPRA